MTSTETRTTFQSAAPHLQNRYTGSWRQPMIRQFVVAALLGLALSACGVGADEDLSTLGQAVEQDEVATSQDPVPPPQAPMNVVTGQVAVVVGQGGNPPVIAIGSPAPRAPGDTNSSSQDPIPPKVQGPRTSRQFR